MKRKNMRMDDWILLSYLEGNASSDQTREVEEWIADDPENSRYLEQLGKIWNHSDSLGELQSLNIEEDWGMVRKRIGFQTDKDGPIERGMNFIRKYPLLKIAAILFLILVPAAILELKFNFISTGEQMLLTVSSTTEKQDLELPDGTSVLLNRNSEISYPETFAWNKREVNLRGEAFFDIAPEDRKPFIIYPDRDLIVEVQGTSFTVRTGEETREVVVQVVTGMVAFYSDDKKKEKLILVKGEQGIYNEIDGFSKTTIVDANYLSWKTGELVYKNTPFTDVVSDLMQYSGKTILMQGEGFDTIVWTTRFINDSISDILEEIKLAHSVDYHIDNDTIILRRGF